MPGLLPLQDAVRIPRGRNIGDGACQPRRANAGKCARSANHASLNPKRPAISRRAALIALPTSCKSVPETMPNEGGWFAGILLKPGACYTGGARDAIVGLTLIQRPGSFWRRLGGFPRKESLFSLTQRLVRRPSRRETISGRLVHTPDDGGYRVRRSRKNIRRLDPERKHFSHYCFNS